MDQLNEYWPQYLTSNLVAVVVLFLGSKKPTAARISLGVIFLAASVANTHLAWTNPSEYLDFGNFALLDVYRRFIDGWFAAHTQPFVFSIAAGQFVVGLGMIVSGRLLKPAIVGIVVFSLAIAPLGVASAFPCTVFLAIAAIMIWNNRSDESTKPIHHAEDAADGNDQVEKTRPAGESRRQVSSVLTCHESAQLELTPSARNDAVEVFDDELACEAFAELIDCLPVSVHVIP